MDELDTKEKVKKIIKYVLILLIIGALVFFFINSCGNNKKYSTIEEELENAALNYIKNNNITINGEKYIELSLLGEIEGTELCKKDSGVLVTNYNGNLKATSYLDCLDYNNYSNSRAGKYIKLNGDSIVILTLNEAFNDPYYELIKDCDVMISGEVGQRVGVYTVEYKAYVDEKLVETATRKIIRTNGSKDETISGIQDIDNPVIILNGDKNVVLSLGEEYQEPGYRAADYTDGKISRRVKINPSIVDTNKPGMTTIIYSVENSNGKKAIVTRQVEVVEHTANLDISLTQLNANEISLTSTIEINVLGDDFNKIILPDGKNVYSNYATYVVSANGTYSFYVYDKYGNKTAKSITVSNIDDIPPTGTCKAVVENGVTTVKVDATDNKGIASYQYIFDSKSEEYVTANEYSKKASSKTVEVNVKDLASNVAKLSCEVKVIASLSAIKKWPTIPCKGDRTEYNQRIEELVNENGKRTRASAVAISRYLSEEIGVHIPYFWAGGHWHYSWDGHSNPETFKGVSPMWGCVIQNMRPFNGNDMLPAGIDCTGWVAWIFFNIGFKKNEIGSFSGSSWLTHLNGKKLEAIDFKGSTGRVQAGDVVWREGHMGFVTRVEGNKVTIAHERGTAYGLVVEVFNSDSGSGFTKVTLMDNYYE